MTKAQELPSPTQNEQLMLEDVKDDKVRMKKEIGLLEGIAIIIGIICGSGNKKQMSI